MSPRVHVLATVCILAPGLLSAQTPIQISSVATCPECRIELDSVATLGRDGDDQSLGPMVEMATTAGGQFVVSTPTAPGEILWYDQSGRFQRSIGRPGRGPGEFGSGLLLIALGPADSLFIGDGSRLTVFDPQGSYARSVRLPSRIMAMIVDSSRQLFVNSPQTGTGAAFALQLLGEDGRTKLQFDRVPVISLDQATWLRRIALDAAGTRWSARADEYRIRKWDGNGSIIGEFVGTREWFKRGRGGRSTQLAGISFDSAGNLWIYAVVPQDAEPANKDVRSRPDPNQIYDTVIEVVDTESMALITSTRIDMFMVPFDRGLAYDIYEVPSGDKRLRVWRPRVVR